MDDDDDYYDDDDDYYDDDDDDDWHTMMIDIQDLISYRCVKSAHIALP